MKLYIARKKTEKSAAQKEKETWNSKVSIKRQAKWLPCPTPFDYVAVIAQLCCFLFFVFWGLVTKADQKNLEQSTSH